jgi:hypothetical protein
MREADFVDGEDRAVGLLAQEMFLVREQAAHEDLLHLLDFPHAVDVGPDGGDAAAWAG